MTQAYLSPLPRTPDPQSALSCRVIAVTGATGALGSHLVPALVGAGAKVILIGRDRARLARQFPDCAAYSYDEFECTAPSGSIDAVIDLATLNNRADATLKDFRSVNTIRFAHLIDTANRLRIPLVVGLSSFHALDPGNSSGYAISKREMLQIQRDRARGHCRILILPKVVLSDGRGLSGLVWKLAAVFKPATFLPTVIDAIMTALVKPAENGDERISVQSIGHSRLYHLLARCIDYALSIGVVLAAGWLILVLLVVVRLDSPGPAIFAQRRVGRNERQFTLYKFRTMAVGTPEAGTHQITAASVTRVGSVLRRFKLDELPQIINVLKGDMSFVGPRPCLPVQLELIDERRRHGVFTLPPGITGLAQVYGIDMSDPRRLVRWETRYLRIRGLALDLRLIVQTFVGRGIGDRVSS